MNYCENCNACFEHDRCPLCGTKKLRPPQNGDFCLLLEDAANTCRWLEGVFEENGIPCTSVPYGSGFESQLGLRLGTHRVFVPFEHLEQARTILREMDEAETERIRTILLENTANLHIPEKEEKKTRKKLKLSPEIDFIEYCINFIKSAEKITDGGLMSGGGVSNSHYLFCYRENLCLSIESESYKILSIRKYK